jgi:hypothetical protein
MRVTCSGPTAAREIARCKSLDRLAMAAARERMCLGRGDVLAAIERRQAELVAAERRERAA